MDYKVNQNFREKDKLIIGYYVNKNIMLAKRNQESMEFVDRLLGATANA